MHRQLTFRDAFGRLGAVCHIAVSTDRRILSVFRFPFREGLRKTGTAAGTPFSSAQDWNTILGSISPGSQRRTTGAIGSLHSKFLFCIDKVFLTNDYYNLMSAWYPQTGRQIMRMNTMQTSGKRVLHFSDSALNNSEEER